MRTYQKNSPQAAARIIALALLSDGALKPVELATLRNFRVAERLGLDEDAFDAVIREFCADLVFSTRVDADGNFTVVPAMVRKLLREVDDALLRLEVVRIAVEVIRADRHYHKGESVLMKTVMEVWHPPRRRRARRRSLPSLGGGGIGGALPSAA